LECSLRIALVDWCIRKTRDRWRGFDTSGEISHEPRDQPPRIGTIVPVVAGDPLDL
jgi:hypothetical protein